VLDPVRVVYFKAARCLQDGCRRIQPSARSASWVVWGFAGFNDPAEAILRADLLGFYTPHPQVGRQNELGWPFPSI
jgi:hypothetical protein